MRVAGNEGEVADVFVEVGQREFDARRQAMEQRRVGVLLRFEIVEGDAGEIGDDQPAGNLAVAPGVLEAADVGHALRVRPSQILAGGLVFHEQAARPEQVNEAPIAGELSDGLLEGGDGAAADAEDVEKLVPEGLAFGGFAVTPAIVAKGDGAVANLVPGQWHDDEYTNASRSIQVPRTWRMLLKWSVRITLQAWEKSIPRTAVPSRHRDLAGTSIVFSLKLDVLLGAGGPRPILPHSRVDQLPPHGGPLIVNVLAARSVSLKAKGLYSSKLKPLAWRPPAAVPRSQ